MVHTIDLEFQSTSSAIAAFLVETSQGPVLVETGPHSCFSVLETKINEIGYKTSDIKHVFLTHIHFDHAGAAWAFAEQGAAIHLHPRGKKHMVDPSKLYESAKRIYMDMMDVLWGKLNPIPENQVIEHLDSQYIVVGDTKFTAWHTPGHAVHHIAWQLNDDILFAGDVAGVKIKDGMTVAPCPPPDINVEDWLKSIELMRGLPLKEMYLTHFGKVDDISKHLNDLEFCLKDWSQFIKPFFDKGADPKEISEPFQKHVQQQLIDFGVPEADFPIYEAANPSWMSIYGLMRYWKKKAEAENKA